MKPVTWQDSRERHKNCCSLPSGRSSKSVEWLCTKQKGQMANVLPLSSRFVREMRLCGTRVAAGVTSSFISNKYYVLYCTVLGSFVLILTHFFIISRCALPWSFFFFLLPFSCFGCRWSGRELMMRADRLASYPTPCTLTDKHTRELSSQRAAFSFFFLLFLLPFFIDDGLYTDTRLPHSISPHCSQQTRLWRWQRWPRGCTEGDFFFHFIEELGVFEARG